jgi:hypothetical protein
MTGKYFSEAEQGVLLAAMDRVIKLIINIDLNASPRVIDRHELEKLRHSRAKLISMAARLSPPKRYSHVFSIAFSLETTKACKADDEDDWPTQQELLEAIQARTANLVANNEVVEAVGAPYDTEELS